MKVALVHELLTRKGGAERVLRILATMFPDAPIYTLLYDEKKMADWFPRERVRTSSVQKRAWLSKNHHLYLRSFPAAVEAWDFSEFDLVISSSSAFAHGIITNGAPRHLCYVHSPARYLWDRTHDILERAGRGLFGPLRRAHLSRAFHQLRIWDSETADRPDRLIAASKIVQRRIELYWRRESEVIYPPIDDFWLEEFRNSQFAIRNYYLIVSQLVPYKRIDLAIRACNHMKVKLVIAGAGSALHHLRSIAGPTIEFVGFKTDAELKELYQGARATLFPGEEDFGLVPLESLACGTPVIAYKGGGACETLIDGVTGVFFDAATPESITDAMERFEEMSFDGEKCRARAREFSREVFERKIRRCISEIANGQSPSN